MIMMIILIIVLILSIICWGFTNYDLNQKLRDERNGREMVENTARLELEEKRGEISDLRSEATRSSFKDSSLYAESIEAINQLTEDLSKAKLKISQLKAQISTEQKKFWMKIANEHSPETADTYLAAYKKKFNIEEV